MGKFRVKVKPNAKKDRVEIMEDGTVKISIKAPPVEGKANKSLINFISKKFKVPKAKIKIISGKHSRNKIIQIERVDELKDRLRLR